MLIEDTYEWNISRERLEGVFARRTGVSHFDHVSQGIKVMRVLNSPLIAQIAFTLHPLFQEDTALEQNWRLLPSCDPVAVDLVMAYRQVANAGTRLKVQANGWRVKTGDNGLVREMLVADKVQNRYCFERFYPELDSPSGQGLRRYFKIWLDVLGVSEGRYQELCDAIKT